MQKRRLLLYSCDYGLLWYLEMVTSDVLVQVTLLGKRQQAVMRLPVRAVVWSLLGVDPEVVEEIVPLPEAHIAAGVLTFHHS